MLFLATETRPVSQGIPLEEVFLELQFGGTEALCARYLLVRHSPPSKGGPLWGKDVYSVKMQNQVFLKVDSLTGPRSLLRCIKNAQLLDHL